MGKGRQETPLLFDANVLIDYCNGDIRVLSLVNTHVGQVCIATPVLDEVIALDERTCAEMGLTLVEPDAEQLIVAGQVRGGLSAEDRLCLLLAKANGWICVTNEKLLRRECEKQDVQVVWGLELLALLVESAGITRERAARLAHAIHMANPLFINERVVLSFLKRIGLGNRK